MKWREFLRDTTVLGKEKGIRRDLFQSNLGSTQGTWGGGGEREGVWRTVGFRRKKVGKKTTKICSSNY
jgi:hypothetical protein